VDSRTGLVTDTPTATEVARAAGRPSDWEGESGGAAPATAARVPTTGLLLEQLLRVVVGATIVLLLIAGALEGALRLSGIKPINLAEAGLSATIRDDWTGWRLRPNVQTGPEWALTNALGMHDPRPAYPLQKPVGTTRVAVIGSSVVYGPGNMFNTTIPHGLETELRALGYQAEAMNFGTNGFNVVNSSAMVQAYVQQFQPDAVVIVLDLQMSFPRWPGVMQNTSESSVRQLSWSEALLKRGAERSALLSLIDDPAKARALVAGLGLPLAPRVPPPQTPARAAPAAPAAPAAAPAPAAAAAVSTAPAPPPTDRAGFERWRRAELSAPLAATAAFCREKGIRLFVMTPYGPYFQASDDEIAKFSLGMLKESQAAMGGLRPALVRETELVTEVVREVAGQYGAEVVDMLEPSRAATLKEPPHFSTDGIHYSAAGNVAIGQMLARRVDAALKQGPRR
jgi:hypothetical protein